MDGERGRERRMSRIGAKESVKSRTRAAGEKIQIQIPAFLRRESSAIHGGNSMVVYITCSL